MKALVTGAAGFIGSYTVKALVAQGCEVVGLDNINSYYDVQLKYDRLADTGIAKESIEKDILLPSAKYPSYRFIKMDLTDREGLTNLFKDEHFDIVVNLAAQAGVRYSIENPYAYIETDKADSPVSLYAATKKSNELMAHAYSKLYSIPTTGVRFFTVYGPWGRPDMAPCLFMKAILNGDPIKVFNNGQMRRDFTYIDDIIAGLMKIIAHPSADPIPFYIYNIGNSAPVELMDFISVIEKTAGKTAIKQMMGMQPGDVVCTYADTGRLEKDFGYKPSTSIEEGIQKFYDWYVGYFNK